MNEEEEPINETKKKEVEDPYKNCPHGKLNCCYHDALILSDEKSSQLVVCSFAPCEISRFEIGMHEQIIDRYIDNNCYNDAYFYFKKLLDKETFDCNLAELERIKKENPRYSLGDLPPACRVFTISHQLKELKDTIRFLERLGNSNELGEDGRNTLSSSRNKFERKMNSSIQLLNHIIKDERYKEQKVDKAQKRGLEKIEACGKNGVPFSLRVGDEVDKSAAGDENILFADNPEYQKKSGIYEKEQEEARKRGGS